MATRDMNGAITSVHHDHRSQCPTCGTPPAQLDTLENEVRVLTGQSIAAANKLAAYEDEIRTLRSQRSAAQAQAEAAISHAHSQSLDDTNKGARPTQTLARFASFSMTRRAPSATPSANGSVDYGDLQNALARETAARQEAERKVAQVNGEVEDLSAQLFEQANEMVATERRARAKLEERVAVLEQRDKDKSRRLDRIEGALKRLDRVKALLGT